MSDDWYATAIEFVCPGCGRAIIVFASLRLAHPICGACLTIPNWLDMPPLVRSLDPDDDRDRSAITMTATEIECRAAWITAIITWLHAKHRIIEDQNTPMMIEQKWLH